MKQRESRYFIDIKHILIERNKLPKRQALVSFLSSTIKTLGDKCQLSECEKRNLDHYIDDYVGYIVQKKQLLQKDLKSILFDALTCLKTTIPALPELYNLKKHEMQEYDALVEKNLSAMQLYSLKKEAKEDIEQLFQCPYEFRFYCFSKYPFKEEILRSLIGAELPEIAQYLSFHTFSSMGNRDFIVTAEPRAGGFHKLNLIYYSCDDMPIFRKLTNEHEMGGFNVAAEIVTLSQLEDTITYIKEGETRPKGEKPIRIGYAFRKKKALQLQSNKRLLTSRFPLQFIPIDLRVPLNREIDCFFHKITDQMNDNTDPFKELKLYNFEKIRENKKILLMDSTESLKILSDRQVCQSFVSDVFVSQPFIEGIKKVSEDQGKEKMSFDVPKMCFVDPNQVKPEDIGEVVHKEKMKFPIVVKTVTACGDKNSHMMALAINMEGLIVIEKAAIYRQYTHVLQEYIEHDERIYKVYGIGDKIHIHQKQSLPNILDKNLDVNHFFFNSQHAFNDDPQFSVLSKGFQPLDINEDAVQVMTHMLSEKLELSMAGYDLIRETKTGTYYLIDINYFPGFKGFKDVRNVIDQHFISSYKKFIGNKESA